MAELSRRQFLTGAALATAGGALTLGGCAPKGSAAKAPSDEASVATVGSGMGKHGSIQVEVITKNGAIERIDVLDSRESAGLGDVCMDKLGKLIVEGQTLNVDVVSGASLSSMAYLTAVAEALDKAGEKSSEWKKRDKALQRPDNDIPTSYDVVVVGAGGAGFTAAISAANKSKKVLLMEKLGVFGGSTALSGGEMAVPGNWIQKNSGLKTVPNCSRPTCWKEETIAAIPSWSTSSPAACTMPRNGSRTRAAFPGSTTCCFSAATPSNAPLFPRGTSQRHDNATDHASAIHRQHHAHRQHESHRSRTRFRWKDQRDKGSERRHGR